MAAMLIIAGQVYLFTDIVLCEYTDAKYDKKNDLYHFRSYLNKMYITWFFFFFFFFFLLLNSK